MITITLDPQKRTGAADGPLVALQDNALALTGAALPAGAEVALLTKGGIVLAAATTADAEGHATLPCATRQVADATRNLPLGQAFPAFLAVGTPDGLVAALPIDLLPNKLPALAALPPAPLPAYWTAEQTQAAIAEAVRGLASEADVDGKIAAHNASPEAHADIREEVAGKADKAEAVLWETQVNLSKDNLMADDQHVPTSRTVKAYHDNTILSERKKWQQGDAETLASAKAYADGKVAGAYRYKGTVATVGDLPASGNTEGDVWNVSADGMNYAWTGSAWDALGASVDLSDYSTTEEMNAAIQRHNTASLAHSTYIKPLQNHAKNKENPHAVTAEQVGALTEEAADARYLKQTGGNTISGTQNVTGDIKLPAHTLTAGNVVVARPPASPNNMARRADFPDWVLAGDGLTASADDTDKVTLAVKPATASTLGGVKVGDGLAVAEDGTVSAKLTPENVVRDNGNQSLSIGVSGEEGAKLMIDFVGGGIVSIGYSSNGESPFGANLAETSYVNTALAKKQDKLVAGDGISIAADGKTIGVADNVPIVRAAGNAASGDQKIYIAGENGNGDGIWFTEPANGVARMNVCAGDVYWEAMLATQGFVDSALCGISDGTLGLKWDEDRLRVAMCSADFACNDLHEFEIRLEDQGGLRRANLGLAVDWCALPLCAHLDWDGGALSVCTGYMFFADACSFTRGSGGAFISGTEDRETGLVNYDVDLEVLAETLLCGELCGLQVNAGGTQGLLAVKHDATLGINGEGRLGVCYSSSSGLFKQNGDGLAVYRDETLAVGSDGRLGVDTNWLNERAEACGWVTAAGDGLARNGAYLCVDAAWLEAFGEARGWGGGGSGGSDFPGWGALPIGGGLVAMCAGKLYGPEPNVNQFCTNGTEFSLNIAEIIAENGGLEATSSSPGNLKVALAVEPVGGQIGEQSLFFDTTACTPGIGVCTAWLEAYLDAYLLSCYGLTKTA